MYTFKKIYKTPLKSNTVTATEATGLVVQDAQESLNPLDMQCAIRYDRTLSLTGPRRL